jgi:hypothetical protein
MSRTRKSTTVCRTSTRLPRSPRRLNSASIPGGKAQRHARQDAGSGSARLGLYLAAGRPDSASSAARRPQRASAAGAAAEVSSGGGEAPSNAAPELRSTIKPHGTRLTARPRGCSAPTAAGSAATFSVLGTGGAKGRQRTTAEEAPAVHPMLKSTTAAPKRSAAQRGVRCATSRAGRRRACESSRRDSSKQTKRREPSRQRCSPALHQRWSCAADAIIGGAYRSSSRSSSRAAQEAAKACSNAATLPAAQLKRSGHFRRRSAIQKCQYRHDAALPRLGAAAAASASAKRRAQCCKENSSG